MAKLSLLLLQRTKYIYHLAICILWGAGLPKAKKEKKMLSCSAYLSDEYYEPQTGVVSFMTLPVRSQDESVTKLDRGARVRRGRPLHLAPRALRRLATVLTAVT